MGKNGVKFSKIPNTIVYTEHSTVDPEGLRKMYSRLISVPSSNNTHLEPHVSRFTSEKNTLH